MPVPVEDLDQLVVPAFPRGGSRVEPSATGRTRSLNPQTPCHDSHISHTPCNCLLTWMSSLPPLQSFRERPPPEGQRVFPLDLAGCISDQKGAIRCVPKFLIHLLPVRTPKIGDIYPVPFRTHPPHHTAHINPTWRCHPSTTQHPARRVDCPHWPGLQGLAWPWGV